MSYIPVPQIIFSDAYSTTSTICRDQDGLRHFYVAEGLSREVYEERRTKMYKKVTQLLMQLPRKEFVLFLTNNSLHHQKRQTSAAELLVNFCT